MRPTPTSHLTRWRNVTGRGGSNAPEGPRAWRSGRRCAPRVRSPDVEASRLSENAVTRAIAERGVAVVSEIVDMGLRHRGPHDEWQRAFCAGQQFRFDILMDIGGFRDMHRHRRCIQIGQEFTTRHGYDVPEELVASGAREDYDAVMQRTANAVEQLATGGGAEARENSQYAIPLGFRKRTLFKMDFAEVVYISELRTGPAGHFS